MTIKNINQKTNNYFKLLFLILILFSCFTSNSSETVNTGDELTVNIYKKLVYTELYSRPYYIYVPDSYDGQKEYRLITVFHDIGGNYKTANASMKLYNLAEKNNFIILYVQAELTNKFQDFKIFDNPTSWAYDVDYVKSAVENTLSVYKLNKDILFAVGIGQGGRYLINNIEYFDFFQKIAIYGTDIRTPINRINNKSILYINGDSDKLYPLNGGNIKTPWGNKTVLSYESSLNNILLNNCDKSFKISFPIENNIYINQYMNAETRFVLSTTVLKNTGHIWPGGKSYIPEYITGPPTIDFNLSDYIMNYFFE